MGQACSFGKFLVIVDLGIGSFLFQIFVLIVVWIDDIKEGKRLNGTQSCVCILLSDSVECLSEASLTVT